MPTSLYLLSDHQQGDPKLSRRPRRSTGLHLTCFGHFSGQVEHYLNKKECLQSMNCLALLWNDRKLSPHHCKEGDFSDKKFFSFQSTASSLLPHWLPALLMQQLHSSSLSRFSKSPWIEESRPQLFFNFGSNSLFGHFWVNFGPKNVPKMHISNSGGPIYTQIKIIGSALFNF